MKQTEYTTLGLATLLEGAGLAFDIQKCSKFQKSMMIYLSRIIRRSRHQLKIGDYTNYVGGIAHDGCFKAVKLVKNVIIVINGC